MFCSIVWEWLLLGYHSISMSDFVHYDITSLPVLQTVASKLATALQNNTVFALRGELGAGKTTFTQFFLQALGVSEPVTSPTFTIVNEYTTKTNQLIYHLDLYRIKTPQELAAIGIEELIDQAFCMIIEWPEMAESYLPPNTLDLQFSLNNDKRTLSIRKKK